MSDAEASIVRVFELSRGRFKDTSNILPAWLDPFFLCQNLHAVHHLLQQAVRNLRPEPNP